jgi:hypothetical protein
MAENLNKLVSRLDPLFVYKAMREFGTDAVDTLIREYYWKATSDLQINTPMVKRHMATLAKEAMLKSSMRDTFTTDGPIRYASCLTGRPAKSTGSLCKSIRSLEIARRIEKYMGADRASWMFVIDTYEGGLFHLLGNLDYWSGGNDFKFRYEGAKEQLFRSIFEKTSEAVHEYPGAGFTFSPVLFMAYGSILEPPAAQGYRGTQGDKRLKRGRPRQRRLLMHFCEEKAGTSKVIMRPVNDETEPKFFCRACKERITPAQKMFYKLHRLGKKVI